MFKRKKVNPLREFFIELFGKDRIKRAKKIKKKAVKKAKRQLKKRGS